MFEAFRFFVYFIPGIIEKIVKEAFEKAMVTNHFESARGSCRRQTRAVTLFVFYKRRLLRRQLLQHPRHGGGADAEMAGERVTGYQFTFGAAQFEYRFQIVVDGFGCPGSCYFRRHSVSGYPKPDSRLPGGRAWVALRFRHG